MQSAEGIRPDDGLNPSGPRRSPPSPEGGGEDLAVTGAIRCARQMRQRVRKSGLAPLPTDFVAFRSMPFAS